MRTTKYHSEGNCLIETGSKKLVLGCRNSVIPEDGSVTIIVEYAFSGCSGLTSITIPDSVTSIGNYAFYDCSGLTSVTIGNGVKSIGKFVFGGCSGLTSIRFEDTGGWYYTRIMTDWQYKKYGTSINLNNPSSNAYYFYSTYNDYYFYKKKI